MKRAVTFSLLLCVAGCALSVRVTDPKLTYAGTQRFILRERADVEQHLFVEAANGEVQRFVWIQYERLLPNVEGRYEYADEKPVTIDGRPFTASVRTYTTPPDPGSDRSRAYALVESKGFAMPPQAIRARLVHVAKDGRSEVMIVYAERAGGEEGLIERAVAAVGIARRSN